MSLERDLIAHLDIQLASAGRLLELVLAQGAAIRAHDAESVLQRLHDVQVEMGRRSTLEQDRSALLQRAGAALGRPSAQVTLDALLALVDPQVADHAREQSAHLRGLLQEIAREHGINRALMKQELGFLSHLVRLVGADDGPGAYAAPASPAGTAAHAAAPAATAASRGKPSAPSRFHALDLRA